MEKRHGKLQRLLAVLMSLMMALVLLAPSAFADDGSATITIKKGSIKKDLTNMKVKAYLVLDQVNPKETTVEKKQYQVTNDFKAFFAMRDDTDKLAENIKGLFGKADQDVVLTYDGNKITFSQGTGTAAAAGTIVLTGDDAAQLDVTYPEADLVSRLTGSEAGAGSAATFYTWVEKYIEANKGNLTAVEGTVTADDVTFTALSEGYYALIFSGVPEGISVKQGIMIATPGKIDLKAEEIPLTKQVKNPSHSLENYGPNTTANVGDTLDYEITSQVPTLTDTDNLTVFNLSDVMEKQKLTGTMTLKLTSKDGKTVKEFTVDISETDPYFTEKNGTVKIAKLTVDPYADAEQKFTVDFKDSNPINAWKDYQGYSITLTYHTQVTEDAVQVNGNEVTLNLKNNDDETHLKANTEVYTYGIEVQKTFSDGSTTENYGAVTFELRTTKDEGSAINLVKTSNGVYRKPTDEETTVTELVLDANGKLTITGLDVGTYWLVETKAPESKGFTKAEPIRIVLTAATNTTSGKITGNLAEGTTKATMVPAVGSGKDLTVKIENQNTTQISLAKFEVLNQKGFNLPQTGGAGTWMFTVGGIVLIAAAGALFLASRKKRSSK